MRFKIFNLAKMNSFKHSVMIALAMTVLLVSYANCAKVKFSTGNLDSGDKAAVLAETNITAAGSDPVANNSEAVSTGSLPLLECTDNQPDLPTKFDTYANSLALPDGIEASPFEESLNNTGQDWSFSNNLKLEGQIQIWSPVVNAAVIVNGNFIRDSENTLLLNSVGSMVRVKMPSNGSACKFNYTAINVTKADNVALAIVHNVLGANYQWLIVGINGKNYVWKTSTKDYTLTGGHNAVVYSVRGGTVNNEVKSYKCSGNLVKTMPNSNVVGKGGCVDYAQLNSNIQCAEMAYGFSDNSDCRLYDGPAVSGGTDLSFGVLLFTTLSEFLSAQ